MSETDSLGLKYGQTLRTYSTCPEHGGLQSVDYRSIGNGWILSCKTVESPETEGCDHFWRPGKEVFTDNPPLVTIGKRILP